MKRWWVYQRERFPVFAHGLLIAAFSLSAVSFSMLLRNEIVLPAFNVGIVAFVTCFIFFLLLRIADEFKDFEDDSKYRPYRPVPRGLVTLRELAWVAAGVVGIQFIVNFWLDTGLLIPLAMTWLYLVLMSFEFFVPVWLKRHPITYMWSHMLIMPLIDFFATACDWIVAGLSLPPDGLYWFLIVSFFNGMVIEIGRKIRAPQDEENGVETYSALWGPKRAIVAWMLVLLLTAGSAYAAARWIGFAMQAGIILIVLLAICGVLAYRFLQVQQTKRAKLIETISGIWTILMYLSLGVIPLSLRVTGVI
jgi:4-hydroxybenzoate polyprenyltransferase